jgi:hypothetical protein
MKRTVWVLIFLLSVCACAVGQSAKSSECPTISVTGPAGIIKKGEIAYYTANIGATKENYNLELIWGIESGTIISGQGTTRIGVANVERPQTVTLEVKGLPIGCPAKASEFGSWCPAPQAEKLDQFSEPPDQIDKIRIEGIAAAISNNPNAQLYIFAPADVRVRMAIAERLSKAIPEHGIDVSRMTFVARESKSSMIQFWLVPPGATPPAKCEGCEPPPTAPTVAPANCPTLEVTGPSGVTGRGTIMPFVVLVSEPRLKNLSFAWTVSMGTIAEGQGSRVIKVRAPAANSTKSIVATVTIQGLPQGCRNVASDTAEIAFSGARVPLNTYAFVR